MKRRPFPSFGRSSLSDGRPRAPARPPRGGNGRELVPGDFGDGPNNIMHDVVSNPAAASAASFADWNKKSRGLGRRRDWERGAERRCFNIATWRTYSVTRRCTDGEWQCVFVHHWTHCTTTLQTARAPVSLGRRSVDVRGSATMLNCDITSSRLFPLSDLEPATGNVRMREGTKYTRTKNVSPQKQFSVFVQPS